MNTTESNVLIANFMKLDIGHGDMVIDKWSENSPINSVWTKMKFHTSWDWLISVVKFIRSTKEFSTVGRQLSIDDDMVKGLLTQDIELAYSGVVNYINWYNNQDYAAALEQDEQRYSDSLKY